MQDNIINTRIQLRYDTYKNWIISTSPLLPGEVAICLIPPNTLHNNDKTLVMHKIGTSEKKVFNDLPWASSSAFLDAEGNSILATYATKAELQAVAQDYIIVQDLLERNNISVENRHVGMRVYVTQIDAIYTWNGTSWSQSLDVNNLLSYFDPSYFKTEEGKAFLTLNIDKEVTKNSKNLITSGAVFSHVENTVGVIENALEKI